MKRAAVIIGSVILFILLVGFNFLMWENSAKSEDIKKYERESESMDSYVKMLLNDISALRGQNDELKLKSSYFEQVNAELEEQINNMKRDNRATYEIMVEKDTLINELKKRVDDNFFMGIFQEWADKVNNRDYFLVQGLQSGRDILQSGSTRNISVAEIERQYENIEKIELVKLSKKAYVPIVYEHTAELIQYDGIMNVSLKKVDDVPVNDPYFSEGENIFTVTFEYHKNSGRFMIINIGLRK